MSCLRKQATGDVSVEVNACPGPDLRKILEDLRCQYETLMERNRKETEQWYACKVLPVCRAAPCSACWGKRERREIKSTGDVVISAMLSWMRSASDCTAHLQCSSVHGRGAAACCYRVTTEEMGGLQAWEYSSSLQGVHKQGGEAPAAARCGGEVRKGRLFSNFAGGGGESGGHHKQPGDRVKQQTGH